VNSNFFPPPSLELNDDTPLSNHFTNEKHQEKMNIDDTPLSSFAKCEKLDLLYKVEK